MAQQELFAHVHEDHWHSPVEPEDGETNRFHVQCRCGATRTEARIEKSGGWEVSEWLPR